MRRAWMLGAAATLVVAASCAGGKASSGGGVGCPVGAETCPCTQGGSCDGGLVCLSGLCVDPTQSGGSGGTGGTTTWSTTTSSGTGGDCHPEGCKALDVVFALDGSGSMSAEIAALSATQAFEGLIDVLASVNCGNIDYRIGVTDDNDHGFYVVGGQPWFDSQQMTKSQIAAAFAQATAQVAAGSGTGPGCEHVLTSTKDLLVNDATGFVRPDAVLVLVLVTDVDDYGAYDQLGGNTCPFGCTTAPQTLNSIQDALLALKGGDPKGLAAIVIAGDPNIAGGVNFCGQPGSCCGPVDCRAFHADRLWSFAGMQIGSNGFTANLCAGAATVPTAVQSAFGNNIDLACKDYIPPN